MGIGHPVRIVRLGAEGHPCVIPQHEPQGWQRGGLLDASTGNHHVRDGVVDFLIAIRRLGAEAGEPGPDCVHCDAGPVAIPNVSDDGELCVGASERVPSGGGGWRQWPCRRGRGGHRAS